MLKLPKVSHETITGLNKKASEEKHKGAMMEEVMGEFVSEQPALVSLLSALTTPFPPMYVACLVWKALKIECENSVLESFMDVKQDKKENK